MSAIENSCRDFWPFLKTHMARGVTHVHREIKIKDTRTKNKKQERKNIQKGCTLV